MKIPEEKPIGEIAAGDFRTCAVFEKYHIDYYNHGNQSFKEAASMAGRGTAAIEDDIENALALAPGVDEDYNSWELDSLTEYIVRVHHKYAEQQISIIKPELEKLLSSGENNQPELPEIKKLFDTIAGEIVVHQKKEELILFPYIRKMADAHRNGGPFLRPPMTKSAEKPVDMLTHEHTKQGEDFKRIAELTKAYHITSDVDEDYSTLVCRLKEFEANLHKHLHLENNILFPKAIQMDKTLRE